MAKSLQLKSRVNDNATLDLLLEETETPPLGEGDILVQMQAAPINPSDLGVMFGPADVEAATSSGSGADTLLSLPISERTLARFGPRIGKAVPTGNEGAGLVIEAGSSDAAQALMGRTVAMFGGAMYQQYRVMPAASCLPLPDGVTAREGASSVVNPMTALSMIETMRLEGHSALVHTAAASNLGQMLNKVCQADGIDLVNIVRKPEQEELLKGIGAKHIVNSSAPDFKSDLADALVATGATLAFDATGGGSLASDILGCMETALNRTSDRYNHYGSVSHKQVYLYGSLDMSPTQLDRAYGMAWGVGGWLLPNFLQRIGGAKMVELQMRVAREIKTTFASHYTEELSLSGALDAQTAKRYSAKVTGEKYLLRPDQV